MSSSVDPVTAYAKSVVEGDSPAGPIVLGACKRHLDDLETGSERGLFFDVEACQRALNFFKTVLKLNGGDFEGVPFELLPWQAFIVGSLFGWKGADGYRRFRVCYVETGKGSGKSPLAAGVGIYGLVADSEPRAEIYAAATKRDQAMILFRDAVAMYQQSPALTKRLNHSGTGQNIWNLAYLKTGSFFRPISADDGASGPRPHVVLLDEIHEHKTGKVVEFLRAGTKGRRQAIIFMITNSGSDKTSVCWDYHEYARQVCEGSVEDDSFFGYVCSLDHGDDPFKDESCWDKVNPSLGVTISRKYLEEQVREARGMPSKEATVRRLNFCEWTDAENPWISYDVWVDARDEAELTPYGNPAIYEGRRCWGGLDLSSTQDLTAFALVFEPNQDPESEFFDPHWRLKVWFWLPNDPLVDKAEKDRVPYIAWREKGHLLTTSGRAINKIAILEKVTQLAGLYDIRSIAYDRWRIEDLMTLIDDKGYSLPELKPFGQGYASMSPALDAFETELIEGTLKHDGNPVLTWNAANAVVKEDEAGNRKLAKNLAIGRIDGLVAAVMAQGQAIIEHEECVYERRGMLKLWDG